MPLLSLEDVNNTLAAIGRKDRDIHAEEITLHDAIDHLKKEHLKKVAPMEREREQIADSILEYIKRNKSEFKSKRSADLIFGTIGIRDFASGLKILPGFKREEVAKRLLKVKAFSNCVKVRYSIIKNAVKSLEAKPGQLERYGVTVVQKKNQPFFEVNQDAVDEKFPEQK